MRVLQYIEIDIDRCSLTYGVAPCTAALGVTGDVRCFNSPGSCQDPDNFDDDPVTLRYALPTADLPGDIDAIPSIREIVFAPARIALGESLGERATLTVTLEDHRHSDTGTGGDPYLATRDYDPYTQGTYWAKFRARNPFLRGRPLRWIIGRVGQQLADMETRHFIIDSFTGPTTEGRFSIVAKDPLKLLDGDRALAPRPNSGFLSGDMTTGTTVITLSPAGIGDDEYEVAGYAAIGGKEAVGFTRAADVMTITRALFNTTAVAHVAQDRVQQIVSFNGSDPADILDALLRNFAGIPAGFIPLANWQLETGTYLNRLYTATIANPTSVRALVSELIEQAALAVWWDDTAQQVGLQVLRGIDTNAKLYDETNVLADSLSIAEQPDKRISEVITYFGQINPLSSLTDAANFRSVATASDPDSEADYGSKATKQIFARWIPALGRTIADRLNTILIGRFKDSPRKFAFRLMRNEHEDLPRLAGGYQLGSRWLQDATGADVTAPIQLTMLNPGEAEISIEAQEMLYDVPAEDLTERVITIDFDTNNFNLRTAHDAIYPPAESGDTVICRLLPDILIGSISNSLVAFNVGDWPAGVTVNLEIMGYIQGTGGPGGWSVPDQSPNVSTPGLGGGVGGVALYTRYPINLDATGGRIWGGGGGGGSAGSLGYVYLPPDFNFVHWGGAGGGGAGMLPGAAGFSSIGYHGAPGTRESGGAPSGGSSGVGGGAGGGPGLPGVDGQTDTGVPGGDGGEAGAAIDGVSYVTTTAAGDNRGPEVN